jgi:hypothetical protein
VERDVQDRRIAAATVKRWRKNGQMVGRITSQPIVTLTLEVDCNPADAVAEELLQGLP